MGPENGFLKDYWGVSRLEYLPAEGPALLIPLLLGTATLGGLFNLVWLEAVLVFSLLYTSGFIINSYNDIEVDQRYKTRVADAAKRIGRGNLLRLFTIQMALALLLAGHISYMLGTWLVLGVTLLGAFFGTAYSVPPLHLKVRGIWHVISLSISAFMMPFVFFFYIVMGSLPVEVLVLLVGFTIAHYGIALANQSGDFLEDRAEGLSTPAVRWGLDPTLRLAKSMTMTGVAIILMGLFGYIWTAPWLPVLESTMSYLPFPGRYLVMALVTMLLIVGYSVPTRGLFHIHAISGRKAPLEDRMDGIKKSMDYPKWQASGIWSLTLSSVLLFGMAIMF